MIKSISFAVLSILFGIVTAWGQSRPPQDEIIIPPGSGTGTATNEQYMFPVPGMSFNAGRDVMPASPRASSLGEFGRVPVGNFTGTAHIGVPLYELKYRDLTVSISINYHASGIRPDVFPGNAGLGWALQAGGVITRHINGESDMGRHMYTGIGKPDGFIDINKDPREDREWNDMNTTLRDYFRTGSLSGFSNTSAYDPDEYTFNINGQAGRFYMNHKDTFIIQSAQGEYFLVIPHIRTDNIVTFPKLEQVIAPVLPNTDHCWDDYEYREDCPEFQELERIMNINTRFWGNNMYNPNLKYEDGDNKVNIPDIIGGFTLIDTKGIKYVFGADDGSKKSDKSIEFSRPSLTGKLVLSENDNVVGTGLIQPVSWYLTTIESPLGHKIEFIYEQETYVTKTRFSDLVMIDDRNENAYYADAIKATFINGCYLTEIKSPEGIIKLSNSIAWDQLQYDNNPVINTKITGYDDMVSNIVKFSDYPDIRFANTERIYKYRDTERTFLYETDSVAMSRRFIPHRVDSITVYDGNNNFVKKISFNYTANSQLSHLSRMKLLSVGIGDSQNNIQKYSFSYNNDNPLPLYYLMNMTDHYGFYNGPNGLFGEYEWGEDYRLGNIINLMMNNHDYIMEKKKSNGAYSDAEILEKITYPTKGYTVFEYEPHTYSKQCKSWDFEVVTNSADAVTGGVRIKSVSNYDYNGVLLTKKQYHYETDYINSGTRSSGVLAYIPQYVEDYGGIDIMYPNQPGKKIDYLFRFTTSSISSPLTLRENHISYSEVTVEESGNGINNGYTVHKYKNHDNGYTDKEPVYFNSFDIKNLRTGVLEKMWQADDGMSMHLERGLLMSEDVYDSSRTLKRTAEYTYNDDPNRFNNHVRYLHLSANSFVFSDNMSGRASAGYIYTYFPYLKEKKTIDYTGNDSIESKETYEYDDKYRLQKKITAYSSNDRAYITEMKYTGEQNAASPLIADMINRNMYGYPFEKTVTTPSNDVVKEMFVYRDSFPSIVIPLLYKQTTQVNNGTIDDEMTISLYSIKGNPLTVTGRDGTPTAYIWSYGYLYPIAEIVGATYDNIKSVLGLATLDRIAAGMPSDADIHNIRSVATAFKASVSTYTYKPLVGVTSITDPRGVTIYYEYDNFGRLKSKSVIENGVKNIIEMYDYHYKW